MQITINNGTVTQIQETLTPVSGYTLPEHIAVKGGSYTYNVNTGLLTLTNLGDTTYVDVSIPSFNTLTLTDNTNYITLDINGVSVNVKAQRFDGIDVQISFTNSINTQYWTYTKIYDDYTFIDSELINLDSSNEIGSISTANGSTTVHTTTGKLFILGYAQDSYNTEISGTQTLSQGITMLGKCSCYDYDGELQDIVAISIDNSENLIQKYDVIAFSFTVSADGSIVIDGVDWQD